MSYAHSTPPEAPGSMVAKPTQPALRPSAQVREAYLQLMVSVATMLREDKNLPRDSRGVREDMAQVLELETQLAKATAPQEERHDVIALYHRMGLEELQSQFGLKVRPTPPRKLVLTRWGLVGDMEAAL
ncbi:hypothetical protein P7K49_015202 [Saguinus oedipus]|uniref:Peptidase M13 N-terminal domain-containing protein n=1 Tax=Saguinus oedipus TaxID=9490 RepID=A0ABQ9V8J9_SAGOE|nr:hypothetical protein P7K49_015202 [Saguinus oedipus]